MGNRLSVSYQTYITVNNARIGYHFSMNLTQIHNIDKQSHHLPFNFSYAIIMDHSINDFTQINMLFYVFLFYTFFVCYNNQSKLLQLCLTTSNVTRITEHRRREASPRLLFTAKTNSQTIKYQFLFQKQSVIATL